MVENELIASVRLAVREELDSFKADYVSTTTFTYVTGELTRRTENLESTNSKLFWLLLSTAIGYIPTAIGIFLSVKASVKHD